MTKLELTADDYVGIFKIVVIFAIFGTFIIFAYTHGYNDGKIAADMQRITHSAK